MAGSKCRIAILQICCDSVIGNNLRKGIDLVRTVKKDYPDVQMIFLPECTDYVPQGRTRQNAASQSEEIALLQAYQQEAKTLQTWISLGGIHYPACSSLGSNSKSTCHKYGDTSTQTMSHFVLEGGTGNIIRKYDKLHLFQLDDQYCESKYITAGDQIIDPCATPAGLLGLAICFDLRFPMLSHIYRYNKGVDVLAYPSSFTKTTGELGHWHILLRARAIENQCYVVAAAQCGNNTYGHSCVIDPLGKMVAEINSSDKEGYCTTLIDSNLIFDVRRRIPMQCRNDVYTCPETAMKFSAPKSEITYTDFLFGGRTMIKAQQIFYESEHSIAFVNIRPVVPNHVLVCCKRKSQYLRDLSDTERRDIIETVNKVVLNICKKAANIVIQDGPEAGQTVPHLHFHILPRNGTEFLDDNDELYRQLENHDKGDSRIALRNDDEMYSEACELRKLF